MLIVYEIFQFVYTVAKAECFSTMFFEILHGDTPVHSEKTKQISYIYIYIDIYRYIR